MAAVETVRVKVDWRHEGWVLINRADFDPATHELWTEPAPAAPAADPAVAAADAAVKAAEAADAAVRAATKPAKAAPAA
jgi:hypothetical protein